jgi:hypothetical protein
MMKKTILILLLFLNTSLYGQSVVSAVNSGAFSGSNLIYSVGEIYVLPASTPNDANSGLIGALSRIEFFTTGIQTELFSDDVHVFPNPTTRTLFIQSTSTKAAEHVFIFDVAGKLIFSSAISENKIDMSGLPSGTYFIRIDSFKNPSFKIIKN